MTDTGRRLSRDILLSGLGSEDEEQRGHLGGAGPGSSLRKRQSSPTNTNREPQHQSSDASSSLRMLAFISVEAQYAIDNRWYKVQGTSNLDTSC